MLTSEQCRAAWGLLNWTQLDLSVHTALSVVSIRAFERGGVMRASNQNLLRLTFEGEGVQFIPENGGGAGVRFEKPKSEWRGA